MCSTVRSFPQSSIIDCHSGCVDCFRPKKPDGLHFDVYLLQLRERERENIIKEKVKEKKELRMIYTIKLKT